MAHTVTVELDTEDVHDLLMALDVIEMLSQDGPNADTNANFAHLVDIRDDLASSLMQEGYVLLSNGMVRPTRALMEALAMPVLATYRKSKTGELVEK
jgi:hypothetical protein